MTLSRNDPTYPSPTTFSVTFRYVTLLVVVLVLMAGLAIGGLTWRHETDEQRDIIINDYHLAAAEWAGRIENRVSVMYETVAGSLTALRVQDIPAETLLDEQARTDVTQVIKDNLYILTSKVDALGSLEAKYGDPNSVSAGAFDRLATIHGELDSLLAVPRRITIDEAERLLDWIKSYRLRADQLHRIHYGAYRAAITNASARANRENRTFYILFTSIAVFGFLAVLAIMSRIRTSESQLVEAKTEAERANNAKSAFLSSMSHELRTPLNAIIGFTQLLGTDPDHPLTNEQVDATNQVLKASDHLLGLIDDVLDLSAIETGKVSLDIAAQDPTPIIRDCADLASQLAAQKNLTFYDRTISWDLPKLKIDATRFRQVLLNLLSNAVKYNRDGGTVTLAIEERDERGIRILVSDTGRGIAKEKFGQVFTPFSRLGLESSDIKGTGIGLSITKELVETMGGTVGFDSTLDMGSTFWVDFPIADGELRVADTNRLLDPAATTTSATATDVSSEVERSVLCIEDNPSSLKLLGLIIDRVPGAKMIAAHTGELGVDMAEIHRPDLILMDINLPGIDGVEALKRLKASAVTENIPVIALTARASAKDKEQGLEAGFADYLTKPINVARINEVITGIVRVPDATH